MGFRGIATRRRFGLVIAVTAGALFCAGCNSTDPIVTESPSVTAVPVTSSPGASSPGATATAAPLSAEDLLAMMPAGAGQPDVQGAVVTAQYFLEQYAPMFQTGDTSVWDALSGVDCGYCSESSANANEVAERGWTASGGEIVPDANGVTGVVADDAYAYVTVPSTLRDAILEKVEGAPEVVETASSTQFQLKLLLLDGVWRVEGVKFGEE